MANRPRFEGTVLQTKADWTLLEGTGDYLGQWCVDGPKPKRIRRVFAQRSTAEKLFEVMTKSEW